jgi:hypothetical protein
MLAVITVLFLEGNCLFNRAMDMCVVLQLIPQKDQSRFVNSVLKYQVKNILQGNNALLQLTHSVLKFQPSESSYARPCLSFIFRIVHLIAFAVASVLHPQRA